MKRILASLLVLCLCASLCACGQDIPSADPNQTNPNSQNDQPNQNGPTDQTEGPVVLTAGNWSKYLDIEVELLEFRSETLTPMGQTYANGYADYEVRVHSKSDAYTFSDVVIKVRVLSKTAEWTERAKDSEISLSADGVAEVADTLRSSQTTPEKLIAPELIFEVKKISGTVEVSP